MKSSLDLNRQWEFTTEEMAFLCNIDPDGVKDYMSTHSIAYKREVFEKFTGKQASDEAIEEFFHVPTSKEAWDRYYMDAAEQMVQGKYMEKSNLLGTMGELGMAFTGMDVVQDLRDLSYDVTHWEDNWQGNLANTGEILLGGISLIPVIGIIGKSDKLIAVLKKSDNLFELRRIKHLNNLLTELGNTRYMMKAQDLANTAMQKLQTINPSAYRKILNYCDNSPAYRLAYGTAGSYSNPVVDTLTHYSDDLEEISKVSSGLTREVVEEVAEAGSRNADNLEEVAREAIESAKKRADEIVESGKTLVVNSKGIPYPEVIDIRTGENVIFPDGVISRVSKESRVGWYRNQSEADLYRVNDADILCKKDYIDEWYRRGYETPEGGWDLYEVHHIKPREFGGGADFENMVPILKDVHRKVVTPWWNNYGL